MNVVDQYEASASGGAEGGQDLNPPGPGAFPAQAVIPKGQNNGSGKDSGFESRTTFGQSAPESDSMSDVSYRSAPESPGLQPRKGGKAKGKMD